MRAPVGWIVIVALVAACGGDSGVQEQDVPADLVDGSIGDLGPGPDIDASDTSTGGPTVGLVNPFIGTAGRGWWVGNSFVGATAPFGLVQAGPDATGPYGHMFPYHCSGYHDSDDTIFGFSQVHIQV